MTVPGHWYYIKLMPYEEINWRLSNDLILLWVDGNTESIMQQSIAFLDDVIIIHSMYIDPNISLLKGGGVRDRVVACWTAGQQFEQSILHQGHDL